MQMMSVPAHSVRYTYAEYLAFEASSNLRHEFLDGQIYGMAGGTPEHAALQMAIAGVLVPQLGSTGCRAYGSDLRVRTHSGLTTYPDVTIVCGALERDAEDRHAITNPAILVEILSRSTEEYNRGDKFEHYKSIPSLRQYVLLSYRDRSIEVGTREGATWSRSIAAEGDAAELFIGARLDVRKVYEIAGEPSAT
jgi:Uma2 family endonuclease